MKRTILFTLIFALVFLMTSCNGDSTKEVINIDMTEIDGKWLDVNSYSDIVLANMDSEVMYKITSSSTSKSVNSEETKGGKNQNVFSGNPGSYHPYPDEHDEAHFYGSSVGIKNHGSIKIEPLNTGNGDMKIEESDTGYYTNSAGEKVWEEYYHIDFSKAPYNELDLSRISLRTYGLGSGSGGSDWGYVTAGKGGWNPEGFTAGLYDFSDYEYINLYNTMSIVYSTYPWSQELVISNPISCTVDQATELPSKCCVLAFDPVDKTKNYVIELTKADDVDYSRCEDYNLRCIDGKFTGFTYEISDTVCYVGKITSELLVDMTMFPNGNHTGWGSVKFRVATVEEEQEYNNHCLTVSPTNKTVTATITKADKQQNYILIPDGIELNNMIMKVECKKADGSYATENTIIRLRQAHTYSEGFSQNTIFGSYFEYGITKNNILVQLGLQTQSTDPVTFTITFESSAETISSQRTGKIYIVPNNGDSPYAVTCALNSNYTVPTLTRDGYTYNGVYYRGTLYEEGAQINIQALNSTMIASWTQQSN